MIDEIYITDNGPEPEANSSGNVYYPPPGQVYGPPNYAYVLASGSTMTGPLFLSGDPTYPLQAASKEYVDNAIMSGTGYVTSNSLANTLAIFESETIDYVNSSVNSAVYFIANGFSGYPMLGPLTLSGDPTLIRHAATKEYVDNSISSIDTTLINAGRQDINTTSGLTYGYTAFTAVNPGGANQTIPAGILTLTNNSQNYIYYDPTVADMFATITVPPVDAWLLAIVYTDSGHISEVLDQRTIAYPNAKQSQYSIVDGAYTPPFTSNLEYGYHGFSINVDGEIITLETTTISLTDNATVNVYFDRDSMSVIQITNPVPLNGWPMAQVTTSYGQITSVSDRRTFIPIPGLNSNFSDYQDASILDGKETVILNQTANVVSTSITNFLTTVNKIFLNSDTVTEFYFQAFNNILITDRSGKTNVLDLSYPFGAIGFYTFSVDSDDSTPIEITFGGVYVYGSDLTNTIRTVYYNGDGTPASSVSLTVQSGTSPSYTFFWNGKTCSICALGENDINGDYPAPINNGLYQASINSNAIATTYISAGVNCGQDESNAGTLYLTGGQSFNRRPGGDIHISGGNGNNYGNVFLDNLPTSDPGVSNALWNNNGKIMSSGAIIFSNTIVSGQDYVNFSNIPQTFNSITIEVLGTVPSDSTNYYIILNLNEDTSNSYSTMYTYSDASGSQTGGYTDVATAFVGIIGGWSGSTTIEIPAYNSTSLFKNIRANFIGSYGNDLVTEGVMGMFGTIWHQTNEITSVTISTGGAYNTDAPAVQFNVGTQINLYLR